MAMKLAGKEEGKGGKAMAMATSMAGKRTATAIKRAIAAKTREAEEEERNGAVAALPGNDLCPIFLSCHC